MRHRTERGSAGSISPANAGMRLTRRYRARFCLVNQQLAFDCSNLRVNHAKAVQLTTASEGDVLYMIGEYFWLRRF